MTRQIGDMTTNLKKKTFSLWIIGPSASGKTTISKKIFSNLSKNFSNLVLLDGDHARKLFINNSGYDPVSRSNNIRKYVSMIKWLDTFGISSIVAVINAFEKDRDFCKKEIKNYKQIYLKCSLDERIKRDKKKLYIPALRGEKKNVVGVDIPFDEPIKDDFTINTEKKNPDQIVKEIMKKLKFR